LENSNTPNFYGEIKKVQIGFLNGKRKNWAAGSWQLAVAFGEATFDQVIKSLNNSCLW
jgi:hypothetical protein